MIRMVIFLAVSLAVSLPVSAQPVVIEAPPLVYQGRTSGPVTLETPALIYRGHAFGPVSIETPTLIYTGISTGPIVVETPALVYAGKALTGQAAESPTYELEYLDPPTGSISSTYLSLDNKTVDVATDIYFKYRGLPQRGGFGSLFYMGGEAPKLVGWFYTSAAKPEGAYKRSADSLPHLTGDWKVCLGFPPRVTTNDPDMSKYEDCLDFVLAGPNSIGVHPTISGPPELLAGRTVELRYTDMPPCNCKISIVDATGKVAVSAQTNQQAEGVLNLRLDSPGAYEFRLNYHGDALRARMKLEIK
ncbi:hypothetical protein K1X12_14620 [Hyphomonas sp. WL0036]|uniref:hypothetical protein n=1 Tax=Hyphomonas sediminis TaxID=2866160 RepID=UPI001C7E70B5|nr:hypothetical protein [Hyphomonas sediminis]MBY9068142.1 hypothetical protein [Hyphomonas sediminis]